MFPIVEPRQRPERFRLNRHSPLAESAAFLGLGGFDAAGSVWYPDARRLLGAVPNDGTLTNMEPETDWVWVPELGRLALNCDGSNEYVLGKVWASPEPLSLSAWIYSTATKVAGVITVGGGSSGAYQGLELTQVNSELWAISSAAAGEAIKATAAFSVNRWVSAQAVFRTNANRSIFVNGTESNNTTLNVNSSAFVNGRIGARPFTTINGYFQGMLSDMLVWKRPLSIAEIRALADPSNVMLSVGGVPLILPPHRVSFPAAVAEPSGFKPYWARRSSQIIGGGVA